MDNGTIVALGYYLPQGRIGNEAMLEKIGAANRGRLKSDDLDLLLYGCERKFAFLGIETRSAPALGSDDSFIVMAVKAARNALQKAPEKADLIDAVIVCGITNPFREPSGACIVAHELGIDHADHFDINDTCNSFLKAVEIAGLYRASGHFRNVLVVAAENPFEVEQGLGINLSVDTVDEMDWRLSNCIVGAGAAAAIIGGDGSARVIREYKNGKETQHWDSSLIRIPHTALPATKYNRDIDGFWADARAMAGELIRENPKFVAACLNEWNITAGSVDRVVMHQLGNNITFAILGKLGIPQEKAPVHTFRECGNMGSVNIPLNCALLEERGFVEAKDLVLCIGTACGYTHAAMLVEW